MIAITYAKLTRPGGREVNEDSAAIIQSGENFCFVVADGLGGHGGGDTASQAAAAAFESELTPDEPDTIGFLSRAFTAAQSAVIERQKTEHALFEMKTTAVALAVVNGKCAWGHIGDSRLYMFRRSRIKWRTLDHSVPQMLVLAGEIRERKIRGHPDRNMLLRALGTEWDTPRFELSSEVPLSECQAFLLCSDGFWEYIEEKRMCALLRRSCDADSWLRAMSAEVEENGAGHVMDNYTAITVIV